MLYSNATEIAPCIKLYEDVYPESNLLIDRIEKTMRTTDLDWYAATVNGPKGPKVDVKVRDVRMLNIPIFYAAPDQGDAPLAHIYYEIYQCDWSSRRVLFRSLHYISRSKYELMGHRLDQEQHKR